MKRDPISAYLATLESDLSGSKVARSDLVDELRDHLLESAGHQQKDGRSAVEAQQMAIEQLGSANKAREEFQIELDRRRTAVHALWLLVATSGLSVLWLVILVTGPSAPWTERLEPANLAWSDLLGTSAMTIAVTLAILANVFVWSPVRRAAEQTIVGRLHSIAISACRMSARSFCLGVAAIVAYVGLRFSLAPASLEHSDILLGLLVTVGVVVAVEAMTRSLRRHR